MCARYFIKLEDHIVAATAGVEDPVDRLAVMGRAYIEFGVANLEPYRIMFMTRPDVAPEEFQGEVLRRLGVLRPADGVRAGVHRRWAVPAGAHRRLPAVARVLGLVHGLTSLLVSKPTMDWPDDPAFFEEYADTCSRGVVRWRGPHAVGVVGAQSRSGDR